MTTAQSPSRAGAGAAALAVFGCGFATMAVWHFASYRDIDVPSFPDYASGTIGDAILLPVLVYGLVRAQSVFDAALTKRQWILVAVAGLFGLAAGVGSQASWYLDDDPELNWMIPEPHHLSPVGWYHALFLVVVSAGVSGLFLGAVLRVRNCRRNAADAAAADRVLRSNGAVIVVSAALLFGGTIVIDSSGANNSAATWGTLGALAIGAVAALVMIAFVIGRAARSLFLPLLIAVGACVVLYEAITSARTGSPMYAMWLVGAALAGIGVSHASYDGAKVLESTDLRYVVLPLVVVLAAIEVIRLPAKFWPATLVVIAVVLAVLTVVQYRAPGWAITGAAWSLVAILLLEVSLGASLQDMNASAPGDNTNNARSLVGAFVTLAVGSYIIRSFQIFLSPLAAAEASPLGSDTRERSKRIQIAMRRTFALSMLLGLGSFCATTPLVLVAVDNSVDLSGHNEVDLLPLTAIAVWIGVLTLTTFRSTAAQFAVRPQAHDRPMPRQPTPRLYSALAASALLFGVAVTTWCVLKSGWHGWPSALVTLFVVLVSLDTVETTLVNSSAMCGRRPSAGDVLFATAAGITTGELLYFAVFPPPNGAGASLVASFTSFVAVVVVRFVIVFAAGGAIYARRDQWYLTDHPPGINHRNDELLRTMMIFIILWLPSFAYTHSKQSTSPLINMAVVGGAAMVLVAGLLPWSSEQWIRHYNDQRRLRFEGVHSTLDDTIHGDWLVWPYKQIGNFLATERRGENADVEIFFLRALGAHLSLLILIRTTLILSTVAGMFVMVFAHVLPQPATQPQQAQPEPAVQ
ncbi:hypothetical protein [Nocardia barduliensis]|uniref:hypothetical protein n=1 Tax=Nocardia barduliensis TaxID=2736643 RepID=UPI001571FC4C|nr:hypothetical protein [Nocardia barduliensis]